MVEISEIICVTCPQGCLIKVKHEGSHVLEVLESGCKRGKEYAISELQDPRRMVLPVKGRDSAGPVYTSTSFPNFSSRTWQKLRDIEVQAPVKINQVVLQKCARNRHRYHSQS